MKKLLLGLGTLSLATLPILAVVSCGDAENKIDFKITVSKGKVITQEIINKSITDFNAATTDIDKIKALSIIFDGVEEGNFKYFTVNATPTAGSIPGKIVLTAKKGFAFGKSSTLTSMLVSDLGIASIPVVQTIINQAIKDFNAATTEANKTTALSTVFSGITTNNFKNFGVKTTATSGTTPGKIVLTAKLGFIFGTSETLNSSSLINLPISSKTVFQSVITAAIQSIIDTPTEANKITALSTVFSGITVENFKHFDGSFPGNRPNQQIRLTAKPGFTFNGQKTITTSARINLNIAVTPSTQVVINKAISDFNGATTDTAKISSLQTTFSGITTENFNHFDVTATPTVGSIPGKIILTAKQGYAFGTSEETLTSMVALSDLNITNKIDSTEAVINQAISDFNGTTIDTVKIQALSTVFNGITSGNFRNFDVQATPAAGTTHGKIVLTAKPGFGFGTSSNTLTSIINLPISPKLVLYIVISAAITSMELTPTDPVKIVALQSVFDGITAENFKQFDIEVIGAHPNKKIHLTAKEGFTFNGQQTITTSARIDLNISTIPSTQEVINKAISDFNGATTDPAKITALQTVFRGITTDNFKNFDVQATATSGSTPGKIVLTAKIEYIFGNYETLTSVLMVNLPISAKPVLQIVINAAITSIEQTPTEANKIQALQTVFNGITPENFSQFDGSFIGTSPNQQIRLTAKRGFGFNGQATITTILAS